MAYKKEKKIKVDIILPNYNSADYIKETIKSILNHYIDTSKSNAQKSLVTVVSAKDLPPASGLHLNFSVLFFIF